MGRRFETGSNINILCSPVLPLLRLIGYNNNNNNKQEETGGAGNGGVSGT